MKENINLALENKQMHNRVIANFPFLVPKISCSFLHMCADIRISDLG